MLIGLAAAAINAKISTPYFLENILPSLLGRFAELVFAPFSNPNMLWITAPLLLTLVMMEFYFGRYRKEELGWNTAVGNSLVLIFVSLDLLRQIYGASNLSFLQTFLAAVSKTLIAVAVGFGGLIILYYDFFHLFPKWFAFEISSSLAVNFTAFVAIVMVYTNLPMDLYTLAAAFLLFLTLVALFTLIHAIEPKVGIRSSKAEKLLGRLFRPLERKRKKRKKGNSYNPTYRA